MTSTNWVQLYRHFLPTHLHLQCGVSGIGSLSQSHPGDVPRPSMKVQLTLSNAKHLRGGKEIIIYNIIVQYMYPMYQLKENTAHMIIAGGLVPVQE